MLMCILNFLTVLRMCYHQLATHIKTYHTLQKVLQKVLHICRLDYEDFKDAVQT